MSTRSSIYHREAGPHVYADCMDEEPLPPVYIDVGAPGVSCSITLPFAAAAKLAEWANVHLSEARRWSLLTDAAFETLAKHEVAERTAATGYARSIAFDTYGSADDPPDEQIRRGIEWMKERRAWRRWRASVRLRVRGRR